jgi:hypothetical protein
VRKDDILQTTARVTWSLGQPRLDERERAIIPRTGCHIERNRLREVDENSDYGAIDGRTNDDWFHGSHFGGRDGHANPEAPQTRAYYRG